MRPGSLEKATYLKKKGAGYTFFWSGRGSEERREAGIGFAVNTALVCKLAGPPKGVNDRPMTGLV